MKLFRRKSKKAVTQREITWTTPLAGILSDPPVMEDDLSCEPTPQDLADILGEAGIQAYCPDAIAGASVIQYYFKLHNLKDYKRAKGIAETVGARLGRKVSFSSGEKYDFTLTVARNKRQFVYFKNALLTYPFANSFNREAVSVFGTDVQGQTVYADISIMPHVLIAGTTGSGKSVLLHTKICSMLYKVTPFDAQFIMIDPKQIELKHYANLPHLAEPVITDVDKAIDKLRAVCELMDNRYKEISQGRTVFPRLIIIIDELADLMLRSKYSVEESIVRIAQLGRAAGIHLVVATQSPRANVITGLIKANLPARIALAVTDWRESGIIGVANAHTLAGLGDALYQSKDHTKPPTRFQTAYIGEDDIRAIVDYWANDAKTVH
jgi:S-DNA-T family DNA segregation ATPase FtsK/SpoIIIE